MRILAIFLASLSGACLAQERATITGSVMDDNGKPVEHATVMVYKAGVKKGYSIYCPTCYPDCGKRTATDAAGKFTISGLNPELSFTLLVAREGYAAAYVTKVDPAKGPAGPAVMKLRAPVADVSQVVRGHVVDRHGRPLRDAVVEEEGARCMGPGGRIDGVYGPIGWIDEFVVTNDNGDFEIAYEKPAVQMFLRVSARGMAEKLFTEATGGDRKTMVVTEGAVIRGRLVQDGRPVAGAEVGLAAHSQSGGTTFPDARIGVSDDGTFAITNVPAGRVWLLYPVMESLAARNLGARPVECETKDDGQEVDLGDIQLTAAFILRGRVALSGGGAVPADMHVTLFADRDAQMTAIAADGSFEFRGLPSGIYELTPAVTGYTSGDQPREVLVHHDVSGVVIPMERKPT